MTDDPPTTLPTRQALAAKERSLPGKVTGRLRAAISAMVWQGARRAEAAELAGITDHSLRAALRKPHVKRAYLYEIEVLRTSERARNIHAMIDVRDNSENAMARVQAAKTLDQASADGPLTTSAPTQPGLVVVVMPADEKRTERPTKMIDVPPGRGED